MLYRKDRKGNLISQLGYGCMRFTKNGGKIDYIHGVEVIDSLSKSADALGVLLPDMAKSELFPTVICDGALPRKTFSMGHAWDKRYYVEARKIAD